MAQNNTDPVIDDDFDIEDENTRAELGLPPITTEPIPEALQFSSKADRAPEKIERLPIEIDGQQYWLTKPSDGTMYHVGRNLVADDPNLQYDAMWDLINICLDKQGVSHMLRRLYDPANDYDDGLLGSLVAVVIDRWGNDVMKRMYKRARDAEIDQEQASAPANRAQRRAAAKKTAAKAPAKKAATTRKR